MATTIQISEQLKSQLNSKKLYDNETYEEVIADLLEDSLELSEETKASVERAKKDVAAGRTYSLSEIKKKYGL